MDEHDIAGEMKTRFLASFCPEPMSGCWLWEYGLNCYGYGVINTKDTKRKALGAHRVSYVMHKGPIPEGFYVCHKCDTPQCVNPEHLFVGTAADNCRDMITKNGHHYSNRTHCKYGHEYTPKNTYIDKIRSNRRVCRKCKRINYKKWYYRGKDIGASHG